MDVAKLITSPAALTLSLALLHFLWQGLALAVCAAAGLLALRRAAPNTRYLFLLVVLLLMLASPVATFVVLHQTARPVSEHVTTSGVQIAAGVAVAAPAAAPRPAPSPPLSLRAREWAAARVAWLAVLWALGVVALSLRLLLGWIGLTSLRRHGARPLSAEWQASLARLAEKLRLRRPVALLASARVLAPTLVGWLRPAILLPVSAVSGLTPGQLEAILAHELAHLRRHDYLVNLLQSVAETLLFYHPAVWWVSRRIRLERECCCDDLAVAACGDAMIYARALTALGQLPAPSLAPAATGGALSVRIRRLMRVPAPRRDRRPPWLAGAIALAAVGLLISLLETPAPAVAARREAVKQMVGQVTSAVQVYRALEAEAAPVAPPTKPASAAPKLISVDLRDASLAEVARALTIASGASIVMDKGLTGKVTVRRKNVTVDAILDAVCKAKGWSWRKDERGAYYVTARPTKAAAKDPIQLIVLHLYKLQFASPQYVLYQLGLSNDPGPDPYVREPGATRGGGLHSMMPEGITDVTAIPEQNALLIRGELGAVGMFINFLELIDKKPQQIIIEAKVIRVSKAELDKPGLQWFHDLGSIVIPLEGEKLEAKPSDLRILFGKDLPAVLDSLVAASQARVTDAVRMATMNLLEAVNTVQDGDRRTTLSFLPRINGDRTITLKLVLSRETGTTEVRTTTVNTTLNVRDGETFVLAGFEGPEDESVLVVTPTIVPER